MDPEEVQMDPVIRQEPGLLRAVTAALCVSVLSACLFSLGPMVPSSCRSWAGFQGRLAASSRFSITLSKGGER